MNAEKILETVTSQYSGTIPSDALAIVTEMMELKKFGYAAFEKSFEARGIKIGFFLAVAEAIKDGRRASSYVGTSASDARANRILHTTNSDGRRTARKF